MNHYCVFKNLTSDNLIIYFNLKIIYIDIDIIKPLLTNHQSQKTMATIAKKSEVFVYSMIFPNYQTSFNSYFILSLINVGLLLQISWKEFSI